MSVLIKGMEKPEHCGYCRFRYDGICHALQKTQYSMNECPLVVIDDVWLNDTISREEAIEAIEEYADRLQMVNWKENPNVPYKVHSLNWCINTIRDLPSIDAVNHTADYDEKNDMLFVHLSPDNSNSYGEEIDKNIIIMRDMDSDEITGVMLYGFNKYIKNDSEKQATIDAVQVVRCKDCKHHEDEENGMVYCKRVIGGWANEEWFCADGERGKDG